MRHVTKSVVVDAPIERVFELSNRVQDWTEMMNDYARVEVLKREGHKTTFRLHHKNGTSWISWRVVHPLGKFALAERVTPRQPFKFMHHVWTYRALDAAHTEMSWTMQFELPEAEAHREAECCEYLLKHSADNQQQMKAYIESAFAIEQDLAS